MLHDDPTMEASTTRAPLEAAAWLVCVFENGQTANQRFGFSPSGGPLGEFSPSGEWQAQRDIGRATSGPTAITIADGRMSRRHARVVLADGRLRLFNESANGSVHNGRRIDAAIDLSDGDVLRFGDTCFVVRQRTPLTENAPTTPELLGSSPEAMQLRQTLARVAPTPATALLLGETGTGKEVCARVLHRLSGRKGPLVSVNGAAIPEHLAESQLFGHKQGAFTGAVQAQTGFFAAAQGGTLFLDEVGELAPTVQAKLLRVLDERMLYPVGSTQGIPLDVRVVAATNRRLASEVNKGGFRADLFARLAEVTIHLPTLGTRREDVLPLLDAFIRRRQKDGAPPQLHPDLAHALLLHPWPFNVRELDKVAVELCVKADAGALMTLDLVADRLVPPPDALPFEAVAAGVDQLRPATRPPPLPTPTRELLVDLLSQHQGSISAVAKATGRSRTQVYRWVEQFGIDANAFRKATPLGE